MNRLRWLLVGLTVVVLGLGAATWLVDWEGDPAAWVDCTADEVAPRPTSTDGASLETIEFDQVLELSFGTAMTSSPADGWIYVASRIGEILGIPPDGGDPQLVLDLTEQVAPGFEQGLLGLALSADGQWLYASFVALDESSVVEAYPVLEPGTLDTSASVEIISVAQPHRMHNGGSLAFDGEGRLYLGLGDGGGFSPPDPDDQGQNRTTLLGSVVRIQPTPDGPEPYTIPTDNPFIEDPDVPDEMWVMGLRNPWMLSIDQLEQEVWIPDVGHYCYEEINVLPTTAGGENFGWSRVEGVHQFEGDTPGDLTFPIYLYENTRAQTTDSRDSDEVACAIVGGLVYRGADLPELNGAYLFSDFCDGQVRALWRTDDGVEVRDVGEALESATAFGVGPDDEIYVMTTVELLRLAPASN